MVKKNSKEFFACGNMMVKFMPVILQLFVEQNEKIFSFHVLRRCKLYLKVMLIFKLLRH